MDLLRSLPIGLYLEQPVTWLHRIDARVKVAWLLSLLLAPVLASARLTASRLWRFLVAADPECPHSSASVAAANGLAADC